MILAVAVFLVGTSFGFLMGYMWRDRISRERRARYLARRRRHEADRKGATLAPRDDLF
jgi:hypothetical protein